VPETNDPNPEMARPDVGKPDTVSPDTVKPDTAKPDAAKPDEARAEGGLARAYDRIKSAEQDLARLDRLVSGMEHDSEARPAPHADPGVTAAATSANEAPPLVTEVLKAGVRDQGVKGHRTMVRALVGLVLAVGLLGAALASQYRDEARSLSKSIMARWTPPATSTPQPASAAESLAQPPAVLLAAAGEPSPPAAPVAKEVAKETESAPKPGVTTPDPSSSDLAQSLKSITSELASINGKLEQLKSSNEQALREQADTIQQLKAAQQKDAADNARLAAQVQALQTQLTASPASSASAAAKPAVRSVSNDAAARARPHVPDAPPPRRPRPPRERWMPPPYMDGPYYGDPDW